MTTQIIKLTKKTATIQQRNRKTGKAYKIVKIKVNKSNDLMDVVCWLHEQSDIKLVLDHFQFNDPQYYSICKEWLKSDSERIKKESEGQAKWERYEQTSEYRREVARNKEEVAKFFSLV